MVEYSITVANVGSAAASGVSLTDSIPALTTIVPGSVTTSQGTVVSEDPVGVDFGAMAGGGTATVTFRVVLDDPFPLGITEVANQGTVTSDQLPPVLTDDPDAAGDTDPTVTPVVAAPDLVVSRI
ncbi:DUF11 domain-containing protein [bacterium]|nr:DUF11 domain-containing protein [bacterium]